MSIKIAINGFGRIGRTFLRSLMADATAQKNITVAAINLGPTSVENTDILFAYDTVMGRFQGSVEQHNDVLIVNGHAIKLLTKAKPQELPWKELAIDWVIDASGLFTKKTNASQHLAAGSKKILITAPSKDADITIIPGINSANYDHSSHHIVSLGSCTTNCFAPLIKVINETFSLKTGVMTTIHAYTNNQPVLDSAHKDARRGRAAALNIIPAKTGANNVITQLFPELDGKISAIALRVPVPACSLVDFAFTANKNFSVEAINQAFQWYAEDSLKGILSYSNKPLVSSDYIGNPASAIFDSTLTQCTADLGKIFAWYDNEFGYSCRLKDFLLASTN